MPMTSNCVEVEEVDTVVISDIHLSLRMFYWGSVPLTKGLLRALARYRFRRLIINGDLIHDSEFYDLSVDEEYFLGYLRALKESGVEVVVVRGNHDKGLSTFSGLKEYHLEHDGKKILVVHGDCFDDMLSRKRFMFFLDWAEWFIRAIGLFGFVKSKSKIWKASSKRVVERALDFARRRKVDYIFIGHTHRAGVHTHEQVTCLNSGCWIDHDPTCIVLPHKKRPEIHKFSPQGEFLGVY